MENKVKEILENVVSIPVLDIAYPNIYPCITFHLYNEDGALFAGGTATEETASCQVDIWYKVKNDFVKEEIKKIKRAIVGGKYFSFPRKETTFETTTKIYHTYFNFELLETEE